MCDEYLHSNTCTYDEPIEKGKKEDSNVEDKKIILCTLYEYLVFEPLILLLITSIILSQNTVRVV